MRQKRVLRNQRRIGEAIMIAAGAGMGVLGLALTIPQVSYGGLCIIGLGIFSVFWR